MKKYFPIVITFIMTAVIVYIMINKKNNISKNHAEEQDVKLDIGNFTKVRSCAKLPNFLTRFKIQKPVMIDLTQKRFKGIALLYGANMEKALHPKVWEQYEYFGTYDLDKYGNIFLAPMPFISIGPTTFSLQKNIYKLDTNTGKIEIFMHFDDVNPTGNNPYGINAIAYDCDDETLWVSAIDQSDYSSQRGVIYHVNMKTKEILQRIEGFDALTMAIIKSDKGKFLLAGSARDSGLYAYRIDDYKLPLSPFKVLNIPSSEERIRKIKIVNKNKLKLQTIPFSYSLVAQTAEKDRRVYDAKWHSLPKEWTIYQ